MMTIWIPRRGQLLPRLVGLVGLAVFVIGAASCPKSIKMDVIEDFSVNLARPAAAWPKLDRMTPAELEAYDKFGKPDFFRLWYNSRGEIVGSRVAGPYIRQRRLGELPRSWIYVEQKTEIQFPSPMKFVKLDLSDQLQVLCRRGDPHARPDRRELKSGEIRESWIYYDVAEQYIFVDGKLAEVKVLGRGTGGRFRRL